MTSATIPLAGASRPYDTSAGGYSTPDCGSAANGWPENANGFQSGKSPWLRRSCRNAANGA